MQRRQDDARDPGDARLRQQEPGGNGLVATATPEPGAAPTDTANNSPAPAPGTPQWFATAGARRLADSQAEAFDPNTERGRSLGKWADDLGLPPEALLALGAAPLTTAELASAWPSEEEQRATGANKPSKPPRAQCLAWPEYDAEGTVVGVGLRRKSGAKFALLGSKRGLIMPNDLGERAEAADRALGRRAPILVVEGLTDTAALLALGLLAVGRPQAQPVTRAVTALAERATEHDREVLVVADDDRKPGSEMLDTSVEPPGLTGAKATAAKLAAALGRQVRWAIVPHGMRDCRAWLVAQRLDLEDAAARTEASRRLLDALEAASETVEMPACEAIPGSTPTGRARRAEAESNVVPGLTWAVERGERRGQAVVTATLGGDEVARDALNLDSANRREACARAVALAVPFEGGERDGLSAPLAAELRELAAAPEVANVLAEPQRERENDGAHAYTFSPAGLARRSGYDDDGAPSLRPLANFNSRIVADVVRDDGAEARREFVIEVWRGSSESPDHGCGRVTVAARRLHAVGEWAVEALGACATVFPNKAEHVRAATQLLSGNVPTRRVYSHTGWRRIGDRDVFLHAAGGIYANGAVRADVELTGDLARFELPDPPEGEALRNAVAALLALLDLAPARIMAPLVAAVARAPLGACDFTLHLVGRTGVYKTELAALEQQAFGGAMDARNLPASWSSTANAIEAVAFAAKDVVLVCDEFVPSGGQRDVDRTHRDAARVLRAAGNRAGRQRMNADGTLRPTREPRGLLLSTGEDVPRGASVVARMLTLEVRAGDVNTRRLTEAQRAARAGCFAGAMAAYVRWLARDLKQARQRHRERRDVLRDELHAGGHRRTASVAAGLIAAAETFVRFAVETGALTDDKARAVVACIQAGIEAAAREHGRRLREADPVDRFRDLLASAIASGLAHVAARGGGPPQDDAGRWGWEYARRHRETGQDHCRSLGQCVGWLEGDSLYLAPDAAYRAAQDAARGGAGLGVSPAALWHALGDAGVLTAHDTGHSTVKRALAGVRRRVLAVKSDWLGEPETDTPPS